MKVKSPDAVAERLRSLTLALAEAETLFEGIDGRALRRESKHVQHLRKVLTEANGEIKMIRQSFEGRQGD